MRKQQYRLVLLDQEGLQVSGVQSRLVLLLNITLRESTLSKVWFTSDTHFGHERIIELAKRPFETAGDMDEVMIGRWNERVRPEDRVYHLGDFAFADHNLYLPLLSGQKHLVRGNHDHSNRVKKARGWASVNDLLHLEVDGVNLVLCHYAMRVWNRSHHGAIHLYGHSHGNLRGDSQSCDVGVDVWDFRPISLDEIMNNLIYNEHRGEPDHHQVKPGFVDRIVAAGLAEITKDGLVIERRSDT